MRVVLAAFALLAAGCVSPLGGDAPGAALDPLGAFIDPIIDEHDHGDPLAHAFSTPSMHLMGHTTMSDDDKPFSYIGEMDTWGNMTVVQVLGRGSTPGFVVLDTSDPAAPKPIGRAEMPYSYVVDVKWSPDGKYVFAASQQRPMPAPEDQATAILQAYGFTQFDMSDPTAPVAVAGGVSAPSGCHMLSVKEIAGALNVFCVGEGAVQIFQYVEGGAWSQIGAITPGAEPGGFDRLANEVVAAGTGAPRAATLGMGPHDITVQEDPIDGRLIASISFWDLGLRFFDVSDPRQPVLLGAWTGEEAQTYEGNVHGGVLYERNGTRLAIAGPELLGDTHPALWVLDLTDFAAPKLIAEWTPPGAHATQGLLLTTHQFQVVDDRIYLAYNHAGLWVLDLGTILAGAYMDDPARPDVLGYYLPHETVELFDAEIAAVPNTWDVNVKNGFIFASDRYTGFYVLHYAADAMGDAALTSMT